MKLVTSSNAARRKHQSIKNLTRRFGLAFVLVMVGGLQATSCSVVPVNTGPASPTLPAGQRWLQDVGYTHAYGPDMAPDGRAPERDNFRQVLLTERHSIVVIADEAHRTQYGFEAKLKTRKSA